MALKSQPVLKMTIAGRAAPSSCVVGLALHDGLLYVVCKKSPLVLVYDTNNRWQVGNSLVTPRCCCCCCFRRRI